MAQELLQLFGGAAPSAIVLGQGFLRLHFSVVISCYPLLFVALTCYDCLVVERRALCYTCLVVERRALLF